MSKARGYGALLGCVLLFSTVEVASKLMQVAGGGAAGGNPFWLAFFRFFISGMILLVPSIRSLRSRKITLTGRDWASLVGLGLLGVTLMSSLYHLAITHLPANISALVISCNPIFVILFASVLLSEKITGRKLAAVAVCLGGIGVLALDRMQALSLYGLGLMFASMIAFALYLVFLKKVGPRIGAMPVTGIVNLVGGLFLLPLAISMEGVPLASFGVADWSGLVYLGLFGTAIPFCLYIEGMRHVEAGVGSMTFFLKPFLAAMIAWLVLGETLSRPELMGGALIMAGMVIALAPSMRPRNA